MYLKKNRLWSLANKFLKELAVNLWTFRIYFFGLPRLVQKDRQACQEKKTMTKLVSGASPFPITCTGV